MTQTTYPFSMSLQYCKLDLTINTIELCILRNNPTSITAQHLLPVFAFRPGNVRENIKSDKNHAIISIFGTCNTKSSFLQKCQSCKSCLMYQEKNTFEQYV